MASPAKTDRPKPNADNRPRDHRKNLGGTKAHPATMLNKGGDRREAEKGVRANLNPQGATLKVKIKRHHQSRKTGVNCGLLS